jgi:hypothetical protein
MNLKDKLSRYHKRLSSEEKESEKEILRETEDITRIPEHWLQLAELTGGEIHKKGSGFYFYRFKKYLFFNEPVVDHLSEDRFQINGLPLIVPELEGFDLHLTDFVYFDLETSGISGGAGTLAFLIGAAYLNEEGISVHQWILPDFSYEHLILEEFHGMLQGFKGIVSFNGKTFDVPVMRNRYRLNRLEAEIDDKIHMDLLHPARRIWGKRLGSCKLQNLEKEILGEYRTEDIPAELIPSVFFNFLYGEGLHQFKIILEHNYLDLVNLVKISMEMEYRLRFPSAGFRESMDFYQLLRYLYKRNKHDLVIRYIDQFPFRDEYWSLIQQLKALSEKKMGYYQQAAETFYKIIYEEKNWHPENVIEYSKILEHKLKQYQKAVDLLQNAKNQYEILAELKKDAYRPALKEVESRLQRIQSRLERNKRYNV